MTFARIRNDSKPFLNDHFSVCVRIAWNPPNASFQKKGGAAKLRIVGMAATIVDFAAATTLPSIHQP